jgi:hypothetical protein
MGEGDEGMGEGIGHVIMSWTRRWGLDFLSVGLGCGGIHAQSSLFQAAMNIRLEIILCRGFARGLSPRRR